MPVRKRVQKPVSPLAAGNADVLPVAVAGDFGNAIAKVVIVTKKGNYPSVTYPHAVKVIDRGTFEDMRLHSDIRGGGVSDVFAYERPWKMWDEASQTYVKQVYTGYYCIGDTAAGFGFVERRAGSLKYEIDYYGPYAIRGLLEQFPNGHDNIHLLAMFPPDDVAYVPALKASLVGSHIVTTPKGKKVKFTVRSVRVVDEPVGGLMHRIVAPDGENYNDHGITGRKLLVVDIGGQVSSMTPATKDGEVNHMASKSFGSGINDIEKQFESEIRRTHPEFRRLRVMSSDQLRDALKTGKWDGGGGEPIDLKPEKDRACGALLTELVNTYENQMGGSLSYNHIIVTGGGGALLFDVLNSEYAFNHKSMMLADVKTSEMHLANVRGAAKMFYSMLKRDPKWAAVWATS